MLPLHHTHGIVNTLLLPLSIGARVKMLAEFSPEKVWQELISEDSDRINMFMAVPTIYSKLIEFHRKMFKNEEKQKIRSILRDRVRLMVSGSAALPEVIK